MDVRTLATFDSYDASSGDRAASTRGLHIAIAVPLGALVGALFLVLQVAHINGSDGHSVYEVTRSLVQHWGVSVDPSDGVRGSGGAYYSKYGIGLSLVGVLPFVAASPLAHIFGHADVLQQAAVATLMPLIGALLVAWLYVLGRRLGGSASSSLLAALGGVLGSFVFIYLTKEFFGEPLVALCIVITAERLMAGRPVQAGAALAVAILVRPQMVAVAPILLAVVSRECHGRWLLRAGGLLAIAVIAVAVYDAIRFGSVTETGYRGEGFTTPFVDGAVGLLTNPTKSLMLFAPAVILVPLALIRNWDKHRGTLTFLTANAVVLFALAATWHNWQGGWCWGPRFLMPAAIPLLPVLAPWLDAGRWRSRALVCLSTVGFLVSAPSLLVPTQAQQLDRPLPRDGPSVTRQYALVPVTFRYTLTDPEGATGDHRRYLALWQVNAVRQLGRAGIAPAVILTLILLAAAWGSLAVLRKRLVTASETGDAPNRPS